MTYICNMDFLSDVFRRAAGVAVVLCAFVFFRAQACERDSAEVPLLIVLGQSNADGSAMADSVEDARLAQWYESPANKRNIKIWYRSTQVENMSADSDGVSQRYVVDGRIADMPPGWLDLWYRNENTSGRTAMNMIHGFGTYSTGEGPDCAQGRRGMEGELGKKFAEALPDSELYILKLGASGSFISSWADPADSHNWDYFYENIYKPAVADLRSRGERPYVAGFWWMQGCADSGSSEEYYERQLRALIDKCRDQTGASDTPFYIGRIIGPGENPSYPEGSKGYGDGVRKAQDKVAADTEDVFIIDTRDCQMQYEEAFGGYIHFSHKGVNAIGDIIAEKLISTVSDHSAVRRQ